MSMQEGQICAGCGGFWCIFALGLESSYVWPPVE